MLPQQYCLRWKYHHSNLQTMFSQLLDRGCFCDVTLACEGQLLRAHRVVLCACSSFFDTLLTNYSNERDPIIIMKDVTFEDVKCLIEFMYKGEINVEHSNLASLLKTADDLKIKGLAEVSWRDDEDPVAAASIIDYHQTTNRSLDAYGHDQHSHQSHQTHQGHPHNRHQQTHQPQHSSSRRISPPMVDDELRSPSDEAADLRKNHHHHHQQQQQQRRLPNIPSTASQSISIAPVPPAAETYLGPKRKRGRPPMDDSYDVFNIHKLAQFSGAPHVDNTATHADPHGSYTDERRQHSSAVAAAHNTSPPTSSSAAAAAAAIAYQQHVEQQTKQLNLRLRQNHIESDMEAADVADDTQNDPEWINSNLEVNVAESETTGNDATDNGDTAKDESQVVMELSENNAELRKVDSSIVTKRKRKTSNDEVAYDKRDQRESLDKQPANEQTDEEEDVEAAAGPVPQSVEEIENMHHVLEHQLPGTGSSSTNNGEQLSATASTSTTSSSSGPPIVACSSTTAATTSASSSSVASLTVASHKNSCPSTASPLITAAAHFGKYMATDGYLLNEHGMLMTHDFIHAPTVNIPTSSAALANAAAAAAVAAAAASNGASGEHEFADIKMEDYDAADLRLTSEEMTQWQDVIKMDDYLAKGRRPQFWEEPFTRRVLDAIKNKRLEMKKAARILGVSYGTLYGRYREVYGCLKHPYSSTTFRSSQSSQLSVQPRFDMVWPSPKRDAALLAGQLEVGKIRPKDLSELWTRPQI